MKTKLYSIAIALVAIMVSANVQAQERVKATLQHNGTLTEFTGAYSFQAAYNAAVDGDTIFLSPGTFTFDYYNSTTIVKSITIQGSGCVTDQSHNLNETYFNVANTTSGFSLNVRDCNNLTFEGLHINRISLYNTVSQMEIRHCKIDNLNFYSGMKWYNSFLEHCWIESFSLPSSNYQNINVSNSFVKSFNGGDVNTSNSMSWLNCYIDSSSKYGVSLFNNCIIGGTQKLNNSCMAYNCVVSEGLLSDVLNKDGNYEVSDVSSLFVDGYTSYENFYKLTDGSSTTYLGQDGTQVGIYGGLRPYTPIPSYPRIVEKNIAGQTTTDGKLRVSVKAEARSK